MALGAKPAGFVVGSVKGFGLVLLAVVIPFIGFGAYVVTEESRGLALYEEDGCEEAAARFERLLWLDPEDEATRFHLALCHLCLARWDEAAEGFRAYVSRHPRDPEAHAHLGAALEAQGRQEEADWHLDRAESPGPRRADEALRRRVALHPPVRAWRRGARRSTVAP